MQSVQWVLLLCVVLLQQAIALMILPPGKSKQANTSIDSDFASAEGTGPAACPDFKLPRYASLHHAHHHSHHHLHHHIGDENPYTEIPKELPDLVFIHIPKNAGSLIEDLGHENHVEWGRFMDFNQCDWDARVSVECSRWHVPPRYLFSPNVYTESKAFCVSRHPYERALSQFKWTYTPPHGPDDCTVENLNTYLKNSLQKLLDGDEFQQDCHLIPQTEYIWDENGHQFCKDILRLEDLTKEFNALMKHNGYDIELLSDRADNKLSTCANLTVDDFTNDTIAMLNNAYYEDFKRLKYKPRYVH